jgi:polyisoprenoid-binding protein YceI
MFKHVLSAGVCGIFLLLLSKDLTKTNFKMKKFISLLTVVLLSAATVFAQTTWKVDKAHARLQFTITHLAVSDVDGSFKDFDVTITTTKPDFSDAKFNLIAKTASVNTENDKRDADLRSATFFDVTKYPELTFTSTGITPIGSNHYKLSGKMTLNGVTKPVVMDLWYRGTITNPMSNAADAGFQVSGVIKRSDFGFCTKYGPPMLSDEVSIKANGEFAVVK